MKYKVKIKWCNENMTHFYK